MADVVRFHAVIVTIREITFRDIIIDGLTSTFGRQDYSDHIAQLSPRRVLVHSVVTTVVAMAIAAWRMRSGLAMIGDSGSYLAGASGFTLGRVFETPLVPSFSEIPILDTIRDGGWSPYADFGVGLPAIIALFSLVMPLTTAAGVVNLLAIGLIALGVMFGPWSARHGNELWMRTLLAIVVSCWPIMSFTSVGVLSEPLFCAAVLWLAIVMARLTTLSLAHLIGIGALVVFIGTLRFVGPIIAIVSGVFLIQRGVRWTRAAVWTLATALVPVTATVLAASGTDSRMLATHALDSTDVFFAARGVGGWFEAGYGNQTATLLRFDFDPSFVDWLITCTAVLGAIWVLITWVVSTRRRTSSPIQPALVLAVMLALAVIPSMLFLDAVLKLDNRILMPSGVLMISAAGWSVARRAPAPLAWAVLGAWTVIATQPWNWIDRPAPAQATALTDVVDSLDPRFVITNNADLVWWITRTPARYLPDGYHDLSARTYDPRPVMADLPCALAETDGLIVAERAALAPDIDEQLTADTSRGKYMISTTADIVVYTPTGLDC